MEIYGKTVLITGASEGIGAACAHEFRRRGARLSLVARRADMLARVAQDGDLYTAADITDDAGRRRAVEATLERFGSLDILINNAGAGLYAPASQAPLEEVRRLAELNFFAPLAMIQLAVPSMRSAGGGMIVNVASIAAKVTLPWMTLYSSTKHALESLSNGLRMELRRDRIHVLTVCPGYVSTRFQQNVLYGKVPRRVAAGNWFRIAPEQCAEAIARGVERNRRTVVTPASGWAFVLLSRLFPSLVDAKLEEINKRGQAE